MKLSDKATYVYIKHIKKWIECPVCNRRMIFNKSQKAWICKRCDYEILESEYLDDFIFWFCDECNSYINCQEGFDKKSAKHICQKCGYEHYSGGEQHLFDFSMDVNDENGNPVSVQEGEFVIFHWSL